MGYLQFKNAYILKVRYLDCTNFEGRKIMVYEGKFDKNVKELDPHFQEKGGPIARFRPDVKNLHRAIKFAKSL